jgi:hypothetical protein
MIKYLSLSLLLFLFEVPVRSQSSDSLLERPLPQREPLEVLVDLGLAPLQSRSESRSWQLTYSLRVGVGTCGDLISYYGFVDYYQHKLTASSGMGVYRTGSPLRHDIATYAAIRLFRLVFIGAGTFYTTSGTAVLYVTGTKIEVGRVSVKSDLYMFYIAGLTYDLRLSEAVRVPISVHYRIPVLQSIYGPLVRLGVGIRL